MTTYPYPKGPESVDEKLLEPGNEFRKEVFAVVNLIVLFIVVYVVLILLAIGLVVACSYAGYWIITNIRNLWAVLFGVALPCMGVLILYFLFKFISKRTTVDRSGMIEITAKQQPALFDFIKRLAAETKTKLPKRVYLSADVNASVFYDSGFWSMFLPVRKNLNIGLGLINVVSVSEFKAVVAHEFGHFSQRSMKAGSYVYHVNHIIYDMLYDNRGYERTLQAFAELGSVFAFVGTLSTVFINIIQEILQQLYTKINDRYSALSRQMEFHADMIAASVTGSSALASALYRIDVADSAYQRVLQYYNEWLREKRVGKNVYQHQSIILQMLAEKAGFSEGVVDEKVYQHLRRSRIEVRNQWASHPSNHERTQRLRALNLTAEVVDQSAWSLFTDAELLQEQMTKHLYRDVSDEQVQESVDTQKFVQLLESESKSFSLPSIYRGFYDDREIQVFNPSTLASERTTQAQSLADVLTEETVNLWSKIQSIQADIDLLHAVMDKSSTVTTFEFDGIKRDRKEANLIVQELRQEMAKAKTKLAETDQEVFLLLCKVSGNTAESLRIYQEFFSTQQSAAEELKYIQGVIKEAHYLFDNPSLSPGTFSAIAGNIEVDRAKLKKKIEALIQDNTMRVSPEQQSILEEFIADNRKYFFNVGHDAPALKLYVSTAYVYASIIHTKLFEAKKKMLVAQAQVLSSSVVNNSKLHIQ